MNAVLFRGPDADLPMSATSLYSSDPVPVIVEVARAELSSTGRFSRITDGLGSVDDDTDVVFEVSVTDMAVGMPGAALQATGELAMTALFGSVGWLAASAGSGTLTGAVRIELKLRDPKSGYDATRGYVGRVRKRMNDRETRSSTAKRWVLGVAVSEAMKKMKEDVPRIVSRIETERQATRETEPADGVNRSAVP